MIPTSFDYQSLIDILDRQTPCVLATVIQTQGSTPQKAGSWALIGFNQLLAGTVGGGITELKVIGQSQLLLESKKSALISFNLGGDLNKGSESICGGSMTILLDAAPEMHVPVFRQLRNSLEAGSTGVLMTQVDASIPENIQINRRWVLKNGQQPLTDDIGSRIAPVMDQMLQNTMAGSCHLVSARESEPGTARFTFLESVIPRPSLFIAGAGHIGQSLAQLGRFLGFKVTVWDERPEFADRVKFPEADIVLTGTVDSGLEHIQIQDNTYLVIVTHGHKSDSEVLRKLIGSGAAYIGMIGSKAKVSQLKSSFIENGWATARQWERVFTPIGLEIGAQSVEEIALSIAAQLVQVRNQKNRNDE
ncbi:MAG TPA: XdhC family protein [Prolixibacteraceae bacterium]|jgi:xanthine dehydrogenase accessory factor